MERTVLLSLHVPIEEVSLAHAMHGNHGRLSL
jgi:hypothetical protein